MAIIAFWSNEEKETGQTMSMVALSTYMAIEHEYKILNISTNFRDTTLDTSYWNFEKADKLIKDLSNSENAQVGLDSGIEGLTKIINSNRTTNNIIQEYTKVVFKDRLDVLCSPKTRNYESYEPIAKIYPNIIQMANQNYDFVFIDISKKMSKEDKERILAMADVIIVNITQRLKTIDNYMELKENNPFFNKNNVILNIGRYDKFSTYNTKNITRYLREKKEVNCVPYNTLFFESCSEGKVAEFFLRLRKNVDEEDRNAVFISEVDRLTKELIYKLKELQVKV